MKQVNNINLLDKCPTCGEGLYAYWHTPASDHPECGTWSVECGHCDYEHEEEFQSIERLKNNFKIFMRQVFELPIALPGLNGSKGLMRQHWTSAAKMKEWLLHKVLEADLWCHKGQVKITYTRVAKKKMDWDNCMSSFKHVCDALVKAGVIEDDSPKLIPEQPVMLQEIGEPKTIITIEDIF